jgi:arylsulfatase A-like enzyme
MSAARPRRLIIVGALCLLLVIVAVTLLARVPPLPQWYRDLPRGDASVFFTPGSVTLRKVRRAVETRNAIHAPPGHPLRRHLRVGSDAGLVAAMTTLCPPDVTCAGSATFRVTVRDSGARHEVLRATVPVDPARWQIQTIDLTRWSGRNVEVSFTATVRNPARDGRAPVALWGEPLLLGARDDRPNVLLVSIDTLRADRLGCYGHFRPTSPHLDQLAAEGVRFAHAISQAPWTTPSHMSLFTGLYPSAHGVNQDWPTFQAYNRGSGLYRTIGANVRTLTDVLRANGYRAFAATGGGTIAGALGFDRGFDVYREDSRSLTSGTATRLTEWLQQLQHTSFFLFFHTFHVHAPYQSTTFVDGLMTEAQRQDVERFMTTPGLAQPIEAFRALLQARGLLRPDVTAALYDGGIHATDAFLGDLFDRLRELDLYDRTIIIVTSDHGEEFADHDPSRFYDAHCRTVYDELVRVPLIMRVPDRFEPGRVVDDVAELVDVAPTILELVGVSGLESQGHSLLPLLNGGGKAPPASALSEATCIGAEWKALRVADLKYVSRFTVANGERSGIPGPMEAEALFDLRADPREQRPLADPSRVDTMRRQLHEQLNHMTARTGSAVTVSAELRERLRALGYLD